DRIVDNRRALGRHRPFDLPELRDEVAAVGLADERREHAGTAGRFEFVLRFVAAADENLDDERLAGVPAPRLERDQLLELRLADRLRDVGAVPNPDPPGSARKSAPRTEG